jgi:hypothetical protein
MCRLVLAMVRREERCELCWGKLMTKFSADRDRATRRSDIVDPTVIAQFVGNVEPGGEVTFATVLATVGFSLLVVFGTTAWWMLH